MRSTLVPFHVASNNTLLSIGKIQKNLNEAQVELSSGRWQDVGYKLAENTGLVLDYRAQLSLSETIKSSNAVVKIRAEFTQEALSVISNEAQNFLATTIASRSNQLSAEVTLSSISESYKSVLGALNTSVNGVSIFSGINVEQPPFENYFETPPPASKQAVDAAFFAEFGFAQSSPAVSTISVAAMESFIDNAFSNLFDSPDWETNWSKASSNNLATRIGFNETMSTSVNANTSAMRKLTMAYTMASDLGTTEQNGAVFQMVMDKSAQMISDTIDELNQVRATVGVIEERVKLAEERLDVQSNIFQKLIGNYEGVDATEVAVRINSLSTQLETAYVLTGKINQLSLLKYF